MSSTLLKQYIREVLTENSSNDEASTLLSEALTKSDKKDIERMIKKLIVSENEKNKKQLKKDIEKEIKSNSKTIEKMIHEIAADELEKGLKSSAGKSAVADVTKLVLRKLYRELSYNYTPLIDRIKI